MNINAVKTRIFKEGEDLLAFVTKNIPKLKNGSVLVVTSKIVALSEGRTAPVQDRKKIIRAESNWALESKYVSLTEKGGMILANAGVDESNADGKLVLLPKDSFKTAQKIRSNILQNVRIRKLGVIISDSRVMPLRAGVVGVALGYAGFKGVRDYRGKKDMFGRKLKFTQTDIADSLATAAALVMGEGSEQQPLCVIEDAPVEFVNRVNKKELLIPMKDDMYAPLFGRVVRSRRTKN
ncbi:MAG: coenzyme F420-0:L-glutamate ligase [Patescibacteria group bacterium]